MHFNQATLNSLPKRLKDFNYFVKSLNDPVTPKSMTYNDPRLNLLSPEIEKSVSIHTTRLG